MLISAGPLGRQVNADEPVWELCDASEGSGRELHLTLLKTDTSKSAPLWPSLIKGHPDIDVSKLQRQEQTLEQMMAEYKSSEIAEGMSQLEREKKKQL